MRSRGAEGFALLQPLMSDLQQSYLAVKELGISGTTRSVISPLFPTTYPFPTKPIIGGDKSMDGLDELLAELSGSAHDVGDSSGIWKSSGTIRVPSDNELHFHLCLYNLSKSIHQSCLPKHSRRYGSTHIFSSTKLLSITSSQSRKS